MRIINKIMRTLWPDTCPFCGKVHRGGICAACRQRLAALTVRQPRCMKCGKPVPSEEQEYCYDCAHTHHYYDRGAGMWLHAKPVSTSVYRFKYHDQRFYAAYYAREMAACYGALVRRWAPDVIVPVPLHPRRRRKRGYNQAELLARELGRLLCIPVETGLVRRVRYTAPQKALGGRARGRNLAHAFAPGRDLEEPRGAGPYKGGRESRIPERALIVDDIYTTGSTIDGVAKVLREKGVQKVYFLTISIGQGY